MRHVSAAAIEPRYKFQRNLEILTPKFAASGILENMIWRPFV